MVDHFDGINHVAENVRSLEDLRVSVDYISVLPVLPTKLNRLLVYFMEMGRVGKI